MGKLVMIEFSTIDGVMQGLGSPQEDTEGGFIRGGWGAPFAAAMPEVVDPSALVNTEGYLLGRRTFEKMAAFWPHQPDENPIAAHLNATPKHVASQTLTETSWARTHFITTDLVAAVQDLKATTKGDIALLGSGLLARQLLAAGQIDELRLFLHPLLLGTGKRLFGELAEPRDLELKSVAQTSLGTVALVYGVTN